MKYELRVAVGAWGVLCFAVLLSSGCSPPENQVDRETKNQQAEKSEQEVASTLVADAAERSSKSEADDAKQYFGGDADVTAETVPAELLKQLQPLLPSGEEVNTSLWAHIEELRSENTWLDQSLRQPFSTSLLTAGGKNPGPNTQQRMEVFKGLADELLEDYLRYSDDSDGDKEQMSEMYERNIVDLLAGREPDHGTQSKIFAKFEAGDFDPLVLFLNLSYNSLTDSNRRKVSAKVPEGLRSRTCSSTTYLKLIELTSMKFGVHSDGEMDWMTKCVFTMLPDFLRRRKPDESYSSYSHAMIVQLRDKLRAEGELDFMHLLLKLREEEPAIVPDALLHRCLYHFYWSLASKARGGRFISEVSDERLDSFDHYASLATPHAIAAYLADPDNPFHAKDLLYTQLMASTTPLSAEQWYRVAMMTQSDSSFSAKKMAWSLMPRFGGSRDRVKQFVVQLIEQGMGADDNQLNFGEALDKWLQDEGWFSNIANHRDLYQATSKLADHLFNEEADKPSERVTSLAYTLMLRVLWDAGDLERLSRLVKAYGGKVSDDYFASRYVPPQLACYFLNAFDANGAPKQVIIDLHQELICGDDVYSQERWDRIERLITELKQAAENKPSAEEDADSKEGNHELADLLSVVEGLFETMQTYHAGNEVDLLTDKIQWTAFGNGYRGNVASINSSTIDIRAHCRNSTLIFSQPLRFEQPFQVELDVQQQTCDADPYGIALFAGQVSPNSTDSEWSGRSLRYSPGYPMVMQDLLPSERLRGPYYHEERLLPVPMKATLRMEVRDDGVKSFINDRLITEFEYPIKSGGYVQFGRRAGDSFTGVPDKFATYKITGMRMKKLARRLQANAKQDRVDELQVGEIILRELAAHDKWAYSSVIEISVNGEGYTVLAYPGDDKEKVDARVFEVDRFGNVTKDESRK